MIEEPLRKNVLLKFIPTKREDFVIDVKLGTGMAVVSMRPWSSVYFMEETGQQVRLQPCSMGGANFRLLRGLLER